MNFARKMVPVMLLLLLPLFVQVPLAHAADDEVPEVTDRYPEENEKGVPVDVIITVTFSEEMDEDTVEDGFIVEDDDGDEVDGTVIYDEDSREATFEPDDPLDNNARYRVELSRSIRSEDRERLDTRYRWYFYTEKVADIYVDGVEITGDSTIVNKSPVDIRIDTVDAQRIIYEDNDKLLYKRSGDFYLDGLLLKPGDNDLSFEITYEDREVVTLEKTVNFLNVSESGATVTMELTEKKTFSLFNNRLKLDFPGGAYLQEYGNFSKYQTVVVQSSKQSKINDSVAAGYIYNFAPLPGPDNDRGYDLTYVFEDLYTPLSVSSGGKITVPCNEDLAESAFTTITVFYDPRDGVPGNWQNLGGKVDSRNKSVTVPFKGFGRYVAVNRIWTFRDYNLSSWARPYVEYLWAKGIMSPLAGASTGYFGLVDSQGKEVNITRGEFTATLGRAMGLVVPDENEHVGVFNDLQYVSNYAVSVEPSGVRRTVPRSDVKYIEAAAINGYVNGMRDEYGRFMFKYFDSLDREQAAKIITSVAGIKVDVENERAVLYGLARRFKDYQSISPWAQPYVLAAAENGYIQGYSDWTFRPNGKITRAEAAKVIYKLMEQKNLL